MLSANERSKHITTTFAKCNKGNVGLTLHHIPQMMDFFSWNIKSRHFRRATDMHPATEQL